MQHNNNLIPSMNTYFHCTIIDVHYTTPYMYLYMYCTPTQVGTRETHHSYLKSQYLQILHICGYKKVADQAEMDPAKSECKQQQVCNYAPRIDPASQEKTLQIPLHPSSKSCARVCMNERSGLRFANPAKMSPDRKIRVQENGIHLQQCF